jgi:hypothetical protein
MLIYVVLRGVRWRLVVGGWWCEVADGAAMLWVNIIYIYIKLKTHTSSPNDASKCVVWAFFYSFEV